MNRRLFRQVRSLARRSVLRTLRQPAQVVPSLIFPLFLLAVNSAGLARADQLPGFPGDSYLTFALAVPFMHSALFAVSNGGSDLARDIETGFLNRLSLTPMSGAALVAGQLAGVMALALLQSVIYIGVGLAVGANFHAGLAGVPVLIALALTISFAFGSAGVLAALRLGSGEALQGLFPVTFVFLFLSSMSLPRNLMEHGWFETIATWNPVSYLIEGIRSLWVTGWDGEALALGFGIALAASAVLLTASAASLRTRITRT